MYKSAILLFLSALAVANASSQDCEIDNAKADLARRLQLPLSEVSIVSRVEKTWTDSSMGCPQPGMSYGQVITSGSQLILAAAGKHYHYHSGGSRGYFFCPNPNSTPMKKGPIGGPDS